MIDYFYYQKYVRPYFKEPKKKAYTMLGLTLLSLSIFGAFAIRPALTVLVGLRKELNEARIANKKLDEKIYALVSVQKQYKKGKKDLYLVDIALPETPEIPQLLESLTLFSGKAQVTIKSIRFSPPRAYNKPKLAKVTLDMGISGSFAEIIEFLKFLERNLRQIEVEKITFTTRRGKSEGTLQINLEINTFFYINKK